MKLKCTAWELHLECLPYLHGFGIRRLFFLSEEFIELEENGWEDEMYPSHLRGWIGWQGGHLLELGLELLDFVLAVKILNWLPSVLLLSLKPCSHHQVNKCLEQHGCH